MEILDYDSAIETLQGTLTTIKDNFFYYLDFTNENAKGFGPIAFVEAGSHSNTGGDNTGGRDREYSGDCSSRDSSDRSRESRDSAHSGDL